MSEHDDANAQEIVRLSQGVALMVMGAGMILAHPGVRRMLMTSVASHLPEGKDPMEFGLAGLLPDIERYLKIRSM